MFKLVLKKDTLWPDAPKHINSFPTPPQQKKSGRVSWPSIPRNHVSRSLWPKVERNSQTQTVSKQKRPAKLPTPQPGTSYIPPHLRTPTTATPTQQKLLPLRSALTTTSLTPGFYKHDPLGGPLRSVAVDLFERYHGLNGKEKTSLSDLAEECGGRFHVTERAVRSLVLGATYNDLLGELRKHIPHYPTPQKSKSCGSSPTNLLSAALDEPRPHCGTVDAINMGFLDTTKVETLKNKGFLDTTRAEKLLPRALFEFEDLESACSA